jgi:hypothetical protein
MLSNTSVVALSTRKFYDEQTGVDERTDLAAFDFVESTGTTRHGGGEG